MQAESVLVSVNTDSVVKRVKSPSSVDVDGEKVMMDLEAERYLGMNSVASRIWEATESDIRISDICAGLLKEYNIDRTTCEQDVCACVEKMRNLGLLAIV